MTIDETDQAALLWLARASAEASVLGGALPALPEASVYGRRAGAFVTLTLDRVLRGCIGYPAHDLPLGEVVARCAAGACLRDPRFPAVRAHELSLVRIELSVLGVLEAVTDVDRIEIGRHGLVVEQGRRRGLLLPQVPIEFGWDTETFLAHVCAKAGLPQDAWRQSAQLFLFEAEVFAEEPRL